MDLRDVLIAAILMLGMLLLVAAAYMEWIGLVSLVTPLHPPRYRRCGHLRAAPTSDADRCWRCRHVCIDRAMHRLRPGVTRHAGH